MLLAIRKFVLVDIRHEEATLGGNSSPANSCLNFVFFLLPFFIRLMPHTTV